MDHSVLLSALAHCYQEVGVAADQLPYTAEFERLHAEFEHRTAAGLTRAQLWRLLGNARKRSVLPRLTR